MGAALIPAPCSYLIKVTLVTCETTAVLFDSIKHCYVLWFPPVVTLDP